MFAASETKPTNCRPDASEDAENGFCVASTLPLSSRNETVTTEDGKSASGAGAGASAGVSPDIIMSNSTSSPTACTGSLKTSLRSSFSNDVLLPPGERTLLPLEGDRGLFIPIAPSITNKGPEPGASNRTPNSVRSVKSVPAGTLSKSMARVSVTSASLRKSRRVLYSPARRTRCSSNSKTSGRAKWVSFFSLRVGPRVARRRAFRRCFIGVSGLECPSQNSP